VRDSVLNENEIVDAMCRYLENQGYEIQEKCSTKQKGVDIVAKHARLGHLRIEAKGGTSTFSGSARFGKEFSPSQVIDRVAKGFYTAACMSHQNADTVALAFPDSLLFRKYLEKLRPSAKKLSIKIFLVRRDSSVTEF